MMIRRQNIKIISNTVLVPNKIFLMKLKSAYLARTAKPGQFLEIRCTETLDPLLPRPFSIHDAENGRIKILYQVVGRGTKLLSQKKSGDKIDVLGPLGNGFSIDTKRTKALLFAGGIGVAPLYFWARRLIEENKDVELYFGAKSCENLLILNPFKKLGIKIHIASEDGSCGKKGLITCLLDNKVGAVREPPQLYTCGPWPMMREIAKYCLKNNLTGQVSLEKEMACGMGVCLGCVVKVHPVRSAVGKSDNINILTGEPVNGSTSNGVKGEYKRVCKEGPVFAINDVDWEEN